MKHIYPSDIRRGATAFLMVVLGRPKTEKAAEKVLDAARATPGCKVAQMNGPTAEATFLIRGPGPEQVPGAAFFVAPDDFTPQPWARTVRDGGPVSAESLAGAEPLAAPLLDSADRAALNELLDPPGSETPEVAPKPKKTSRPPTHDEAG